MTQQTQAGSPRPYSDRMYDALVKAYGDMPEKAQFLESIKDDAYRQKMHRALTQSYNDMPDYDTFSRDMMDSLPTESGFTTSARKAIAESFIGRGFAHGARQSFIGRAMTGQIDPPKEQSFGEGAVSMATEALADAPLYMLGAALGAPLGEAVGTAVFPGPGTVIGGLIGGGAVGFGLTTAAKEAQREYLENNFETDPLAASARILQRTGKDTLIGGLVGPTGKFVKPIVPRLLTEGAIVTAGEVVLGELPVKDAPKAYASNVISSAAVETGRRLIQKKTEPKLSVADAVINETKDIPKKTYSSLYDEYKAAKGIANKYATLLDDLPEDKVDDTMRKIMQNEGIRPEISEEFIAARRQAFGPDDNSPEALLNQAKPVESFNDPLLTSQFADLKTKHSAWKQAEAIADQFKEPSEPKGGRPVGSGPKPSSKYDFGFETFVGSTEKPIIDPASLQGLTKQAAQEYANKARQAFQTAKDKLEPRLVDHFFQSKIGGDPNQAIRYGDMYVKMNRKRWFNPPDRAKLEVEAAKQSEAIGKERDYIKQREALQTAFAKFREQTGGQLDDFIPQVQKKYGNKYDATLNRMRLDEQYTDFIDRLGDPKAVANRYIPQPDVPWFWTTILHTDTIGRIASRKYRQQLGLKVGQRAKVDVDLTNPKYADVASTIQQEHAKLYENNARYRYSIGAAFDRLRSKGKWSELLDDYKYKMTNGIIGKRTKQADIATSASDMVTVTNEITKDISAYLQRLGKLGVKQQLIDKEEKLLVSKLSELYRTTPRGFLATFNEISDFINRRTILNPLKIAVKNYVKRNPQLFPTNLRESVYKNLSSVDQQWIEDRFVSSLLSRTRWRGEKSPYTKAVATLNNAETWLKLAYRPIAAAVNSAYGVFKSTTKSDVGFIRTLREASAFMKSARGKALLQAETEKGSLGLSIATDKLGNPIPPTALYKGLGLFSKAEIPNRRLGFTVGYLDGLRQGLTEPQALEYARRMNRMINNVYVLSAIPRYMRNPTARVLTHLKRFLQSEMEFMSGLSGKEWLRYGTFMTALVGPMGIVKMLQSVPMLDYFGWLTKLQTEMSKAQIPQDVPVIGGENPLAGLPGLAGVDVGPQATLQIPNSSEDLYGLLIGDFIRLYQGAIKPWANEFIPKDVAKNEALKTILTTPLVARNLLRVWDAVVNQDGWVLSSDGTRLYKLDDGFDIAWKVLGGSLTEETGIQMKEQERYRIQEKLNESHKVLSSRLRKAANQNGKIPTELIEDMVKIALYDPKSIPGIIQSAKLPPETEAVLRANMRQKMTMQRIYMRK